MSNITAIVPAHNEAERISEVLGVLSKSSYIDEIIVVDDGSSDNTSDIVRKNFPNARLMTNPKNLGKGSSMDIAVAAAKNDFVMFADADIHGLTTEHISQIVKPVLEGKLEMNIGMRYRSIYSLKFPLYILPLVGGERALTKSLWVRLPNFYKQKFRIETGLNYYAKHHGKGFGFVVMYGVDQTRKETKYGFWKGLRRRASMYWDQLLAEVSLRIGK